MTDARETLSYRDIKRIVLERIQNRTWPPDGMLPSEVDLAEEFHSTRTTVNRALRELADEGIIERKRKAGTRVLQSPQRRAEFAIPLVRDEVSAMGADYRYSLVERTQMPAPDWLSSKLELASGQDVLHVRCMHYADAEAFQYEDRWIILTSIPEAQHAGFDTISPSEWLVRTVPFTDLRLTFMATKADQVIADFLGATIGDAVFTAERTTWQGTTPITLARMYFKLGYKMTT